ncbi:MAG: YifB family Mg chelatase-like AAA ATPase [Patescibacteria group bacterium]
MLARIKTLCSTGIDVYDVDCEASITNGLPNFTIVGLAEKSIQESKERARVVLKGLEEVDERIEYPLKRIVVNLAPAEIVKRGNQYDLAFVISILVAQGYIQSDLVEDCIFLGELNLDGSIKKVNNIVSYLLHCNNNHPSKKIIIPQDNIEEAEILTNGNVFCFNKIKDLVEFLIKNENKYQVEKKPLHDSIIESEYCINSIIGQTIGKRAIEIAAAGGHNLLLIGEQGSGKTLLAKTLESLLPNLNHREMLEVSRIKSMIGLVGKEIVSNWRPFRSPHHTASTVAILGGGSKVSPGEISLAHNGVLFLDELTEFDKRLLDSLRQPLEDQKVSISRANGKVTFPAAFQLIATMNPSFEGGFISRKLEENKEFKKISGPILDRFDIQLQIFKPSNLDIKNKSKENPGIIRDRIKKAFFIQSKRFSCQKRNSQMTIHEIDLYCILDREANEYLLQFRENKNLSMRGFHKVLKLARTIADLDESLNIQKKHIIEATQFRLK